MLSTLIARTNASTAAIVIGFGVLSIAPTLATAQSINCACDSTFSAGDRVIALVDNPSNATDLPAGTLGTVLCGFDSAGSPDLNVLVRWDGWIDGSTANVSLCSCAAPSGDGEQGDWFVACSEIQVATFPVTNVTQGTIHTTLQDALDNANSGDAIEIAAGTLNEDNVIVPEELSVSIKGAGMNQTIIDGGGAANPDNPVLQIIDPGPGAPERDVTISDLTIQNGNSTHGTGGMNIFDNTNAWLTRVAFRSNTGANPAHLLVASQSNVEVEQCIFEGGTASDVIAVGNVETYLMFTNCLFYGNNAPDSIIWHAGGGGAVVTLVNCTFVGTSAEIYAGFPGGVVANCVSTIPTLGAATASFSLFGNASATNGNIAGTPTFVDAAANDYRLNAISLGIDAADADAFLAAGGGFVDLGGVDRTVDQPSVTDVGQGVLTHLDMGAYETAAAPAINTCAPDLNDDGSVDFSDLVALLAAWGSCP